MILAAMATHGVHRLVAVSHAVARDPADRLGLGGRARIRLAYASRPSAYREIVRTAERIRASSVDWTLVRGRHLEHVLQIYAEHYNAERPHRGLDLGTPKSAGTEPDERPWAAFSSVGTPFRR